jgi:hypothetical protein
MIFSLWTQFAWPPPLEVSEKILELLNKKDMEKKKTTQI